MNDINSKLPREYFTRDSEAKFTRGTNPFGQPSKTAATPNGWTVVALENIPGVGTSPASLVYDINLDNRMNQIEQELKDLKSQVGQLIDGSIEMDEASMVQDDFDLEEAKHLIKTYFEKHHGEEITYVDLMNVFNIPLPVMVSACESLEAEGKIAAIS